MSRFDLFSEDEQRVIAAAFITLQERLEHDRVIFARDARHDLFDATFGRLKGEMKAVVLRPEVPPAGPPVV